MPAARPCSRTRPSYIQTCLVAISITLEAYEAVSATLPDGYVAAVPKLDERGGVRFIVDHKTLDQLTALRGPGESYSDVILRCEG
jgi:hypothetical protein